MSFTRLSTPFGISDYKFSHNPEIVSQEPWMCPCMSFSWLHNTQLIVFPGSIISLFLSVGVIHNRSYSPPGSGGEVFVSGPLI